MLIEADCDASICDKRGNPAAYYLEHQSELELPETERMSSRKIANNKESESLFCFLKNILFFVKITHSLYVDSEN